MKKSEMLICPLPEPSLWSLQNRKLAVMEDLLSKNSSSSCDLRQKNNI